MSKIKYIKCTFCIICILLMIFENILMTYSPIFTYIDEAIVLSFFFLFIIKGKMIITKYEKRQIILILFILIIGISSNLIESNNVKIQSVLIDIFSYIKIFLIYFSAINLINETESRIILKYLSKILKIFVLTVFLLGLLNLIIKNDIMTYDFRYGINSYRFLYENPGDLATVMLTIIIIFLADFQFNKTKENKFFILCSIITMILTIRAISLATVFIFAVLYCILILKRNKIKFKYIFISSLVVIIIGFPQVKQYLLNNETPRAQLIKYGIITANDYFPLGAGFAMYGSDIAAEDYSNLYYKYEFNNRYGLSKKQKYFLNDNFWPMIMGELGYIGVLLYIFLLYNMYKNFKYKSKDKEFIKLALYTAFAYMIISSLGSKILVHYMGPMIFLTLGIILTNNKKIND